MKARHAFLKFGFRHKLFRLSKRGLTKSKKTTKTKEKKEEIE